MKNLIKIGCVLLIASCLLHTAFAQTKIDKKAARIAEINDLVNSRNYIFKANYVNPSRGGGKALTSDYDLVVAKDSIIAFLPYFGRAYLADYGSTDGGIKFTWTHFDYKATSGKKGNHEILIIPQNRNISNPKDVQSLRLSISQDGYASLQIINSNRDPIIFDGTIEKRRKLKND
jgi:hypothetical protein